MSQKLNKLNEAFVFQLAKRMYRNFAGEAEADQSKSSTK